MVNLDDPAIYKKLDLADMLDQLYGLPQQCLTAWYKALSFKLPENYKNIDKIVILGMGGSAIAGDLLKSLVSSTIRQFVYINRDYSIPAFIDEKTLVIACSYSGNTEEILTAFNKTLRKECKKIAVTSGGKLLNIAKSSGVPVFVIEHRSQPRAALGYSFMPLLAFLRNLGIIKATMFNIDNMVELLKHLSTEWHIGMPVKNNKAKQISLAIHGKIAVIYADELAGEAGHRWKTQINENAKSWAFYEVFPELNHNSVVGYKFPAEMSGKIFVIFLQIAGTYKRTTMRYQVTSELLQQNNIDFMMVDSPGDDDLSRLMGLVYLGDWVSYYLSILNETDPTPVEAIDYLKQKLGNSPL
jgi:glucose/mannose-6-phosphate isomerase